MASDGKGRSGVLWDVVTEVCKSAKVISGMFGVLLGGGGVERGKDRNHYIVYLQNNNRKLSSAGRHI